MKRILSVLMKILTMFGTILTVFLMVLASMIYFSIQWMFDTWNNLTMDELVFHLKAPLEGTNDGMIKEYMSRCLAPAMLILIVAVILFIAWRKKRIYYIFMSIALVAALSVTAVSVRGAWGKLDTGSYMEAKGTYSTFIDDNYVNPTDVTLKFPDEKRNLVYIFLESMEMTYADVESGGAFKKNVIPELTRLAEENEDFSGETDGLNGGYVMPGATWTIGAMFAQTSGLPLNISISRNSMDTQESFFSGVVTLGDILEEAGYSQTLMIGSEATFGGRKLYFTEHGEYDILDYDYAIDESMIPADYRVWWGYEDQKLFKFAKERIMELAQSEEPFNFTVLTVDTHFEDGYLCDICRDSFLGDQYANVMACSSRQVSEFVKWIQQQDFYENTTIVLVGDHLTMDSNFCEDVDEEYMRRVYTSYINPAVEVEVQEKRIYTTFDIFPTTLAALGVDIEGERLALGTNLFSSAQTFTERFGIETESKEIEKKSGMLEKLADLDENAQELLIREGKVPKAVVKVEEYGTEGLPVRVSEFEYIPKGVAKVWLAVWMNEDQSDLQWIKMQIQEDNSYYTAIDMLLFGDKAGEYNIHAYVIDGAGEQYQVGTAIGLVN